MVYDLVINNTVMRRGVPSILRRALLQCNITYFQPSYYTRSATVTYIFTSVSENVSTSTTVNPSALSVIWGTCPPGGTYRPGTTYTTLAYTSYTGTFTSFDMTAVPFVYFPLFLNHLIADALGLDITVSRPVSTYLKP